MEQSVKSPRCDMSQDETAEMLTTCSDDKVIDHLYAFGMMMITEIGQRADRIEAKANWVVGWASAILAFLYTQLEQAQYGQPSSKIACRFDNAAFDTLFSVRVPCS